MKEVIEVSREAGAPSRIIIGDALDELAALTQGRRVVIVTDSNVHRRYREIIDPYEHIIIGMGETNKTLATAERIYHELVGLNADRKTFLLGFGGGIVTDITGFAASTYMRGMPFGFVASTLLAQVDASVGGKNGVNFEGYKNMVGTFNQPEFVLCDLGLTDTLSDREFAAGCAEIIKSGIIADAELFGLFEKHALADFRSDKQLLLKAVAGAVRVKAAIVGRDEKETGERRKLNLGHTFAHAVEKTTSNFLHGEAVGIGMVTAASLAVLWGCLDEPAAARITAAVANAGLPTASGIDAKRLFKALQMDKKRERDDIHLVLPTGIGNCEIRRTGFAELEGIMPSLAV
ncbi:MAG: 3-dehydroquinate synthase [Rikenellaceae bacterium]|nr:3-dehydroquinate synthase [Rikenellaceae bacterium]